MAARVQESPFPSSDQHSLRQVIGLGRFVPCSPPVPLWSANVLSGGPPSRPAVSALPVPSKMAEKTESSQNVKEFKTPLQRNGKDIP